MAALSERSQRLEAELQAARGREAQLQEELQAAKRAASALQRTPSMIGGGWLGGLGSCGVSSHDSTWQHGFRTPGRLLEVVEHPCLPSHAPPLPLPCPFMLPPPAAMSPGASRTLSNLEQMESPGTIPAVPAATGAAAGAAPAAGLSAQRAEAVETLKSAAVQRRLPVVPVPLGAAGACWARCELCMGQ